VGRDGHWGLSGMRERAERIGGKLRVMSRLGGGTEVELRVPNHIAFESPPSSRTSKWLTGLHRPQKEDELTPK
jgi:signal transduction histidine kinase